MVTFIVVSIIAGAAPAIVVHTDRFPTDGACERVLQATAAAAMDAFNASAVGPARISEVTDERGWKVLRTPAGRAVLQLRCQDESESSNLTKSGRG